MSISDLFDSGFRRRNQDHFAAIVRVAMEDDVISDAEREFLDRLAINLEISSDDYKSILKDYKSHPINPPISFNYRLERLYDLARMVYADEIDRDDEIKLLTKIAVGLGFSTVNVGYIVDKALRLVKEGADLEGFIDGIKTMNH